ncbi:hypothetical protein AeRB84_016515 [Aphanomyces euteiches]|nr:hypothetical protein AeRB84_016515 [Aphanomyces euteiches]
MTREIPGRDGSQAKKRKVNVVSAWTVLPRDLIIKIAFSIPDAADLFSFLKALLSFNVLGPLKHLHDLGLKQKHRDLWPCLRLNTATLVSRFKSSYDVIAKYYSSVLIHDVTDVKWLRKHLNPAVQVEWIAGGLPIPQEILDEWTELRITRLNGYFYRENTSALTHVFTRLPHLSSFVMDVKDTFDHVCALLPHCALLTDLKLLCMTGPKVKESNLLDLAAWLSSKPVQKFSFDAWDSWKNISIAVRQKFYEAMVNCPTMDELTLYTTGANGLDFSKFNFSMRSLDTYHANWQFIESMAGRLEGSRVTDLKIFACHAREKSAYEALLKVLPKTSIKSLRWHNIKLDQEQWREFVPLLAKCTLERLTLH